MVAVAIALQAAAGHEKALCEGFHGGSCRRCTVDAFNGHNAPPLGLVLLLKRRKRDSVLEDTVL
jgi:hypothetical protein